MISAERWYDSDPDLTQHYQGDVFSNIPFPTLPTALPQIREESWPLLRPLKGQGKTMSEFMAQLPKALLVSGARDVPDRWTHAEGEFVAVSIKRRNVMVVSRSCSLDNPARKHRLVAPLQVVDELPPEQKQDDKLADLRENKIPHFFYLPPKEGLKESYADLLMLTPMHRSFFSDEKLDARLLARLSSTGMDALQHFLSEHFGKQFGFDHEDVCPQAGRYACSNCFHSGMTAQPKQFYASELFGKCEKCGEDAAWVKL